MSTGALSERLPTSAETEKAANAVQAIAQAMTKDGALPFAVRRDDQSIEVELPPALGRMVLELLTYIARGEMVTLVPYGAELSTQRAADLLNVSRPFLTKLLESGEIDFHKVGTHRRVRVENLLTYKDRRDKVRSNALERLQVLGQEYDAK